ncbi:alpha/beta hydrolase [Rudaea sp.]|uniref:alpha/beta fold hydrolase n=1 Tax=Rudaea sp. TaxID=2136325 RepID=UPI002ED4D695
MTAAAGIDSFADVPGGRVFVRRWNAGRGARAPIVLLHDSLGCVEQWRDFPQALAQATQSEVVAYDRLGFGRSTARAGLPSVDFIREEAEVFFPALRRALGLTRYSLFGHSVGGGMALTIAALDGEGCEAVVTESAQAFVDQRTRAGILAARAQFADPAQFAKIARWHGDKARWVLDAWTEVWLSPAFADWSLYAYLGQIECPVLAIHGDLDEYGSVEFPRRIADGVSGPARLAILEGCGHVPHRERSAEVLQLVASFASDRYGSLIRADESLVVKPVPSVPGVEASPLAQRACGTRCSRL